MTTSSFHDQTENGSRPMTAANLREIAAWVDVLDKIARAYIDLTLSAGIEQRSELLAAMETVSGTEVQDDLRRWADEMDERAEQARRYFATDPGGWD